MTDIKECHNVTFSKYKQERVGIYRLQTNRENFKILLIFFLGETKSNNKLSQNSVTYNKLFSITSLID